MNTKHIGYAGRTKDRLRFEGDPHEIHLEFSKELAEHLLTFIVFAEFSSSTQGGDPLAEPLKELKLVLLDMGFKL